MAKNGDVSSGKKVCPKKVDQSELAKLKEELKRVKAENEILKKPKYSFGMFKARKRLFFG